MKHSSLVISAMVLREELVPLKPDYRLSAGSVERLPREVWKRDFQDIKVRGFISRADVPLGRMTTARVSK